MLVLLLQAWLLQASSAEFLTPVLDHGNANLDLCQQETVVSCNLVKIDLDSLDASTVAFMGATLDFLDQPGDNTYTFSSEDGAEAGLLGSRRSLGSRPTCRRETSSSSQTWTTATGAMWSLRRIRTLSLMTWLRRLHHRPVKRHGQMQLPSIWGRMIQPPLSRTP